LIGALFKQLLPQHQVVKERELKILSALSQLTEPTRPTEIGQLVGENPLNTGRALAELGKGGLAVLTDKEQNLWAVTEIGQDYIEEQNQLTVSQTLSQGSVTGTAQKTPQEGTIPSQAETFKAEGQRLGVDSRKGDIKLDAIVTYVERTADLDNFTSVWEGWSL